MKLLDAIRDYRRRNAPVVEEPEAQAKFDVATKLREAKRDIRMQVYDAPADFNRATRRAVGMLSRIWRWDPQLLGIEPQAPRYIRRHYQADRTVDGVFIDGAFTHPKTRRQRRHRARIIAIVQKRGSL